MKTKRCQQRTSRRVECAESRIEVLESRIAPASFVVTTDADTVDANDGKLSLREAMQMANASAGLDTITFNIQPPAGYKQIMVGSALPVVTDPLIIRGSTQPGISPGTPGITLNGSGAGAANGIEVTVGNSIIEGLVINRFSGYGILLHVNGGNTVDNCCVGVDHDYGEIAAPNLKGGIFIDNVPNNTVQFSLVSGNKVFGIDIADINAKNNVIQFSTIGLDRPGTHALANEGPGVRIEDAASMCKLDGNFISGNLGDGVQIIGKLTKQITLTRNYIGTDVSGLAAVPNQKTGVFIGDSHHVTIGGVVMVGMSAQSGRNVISGNKSDGVFISGNFATDNVVISNYIGLAANGSNVLSNLGNGVFVAAPFNKIGGTAATDRNVISGNVKDGIALLDADKTTIFGNYIGTDANGTRAGTQSFGNQRNGITVAGASLSQIGGGGAGERNVISDNFGDGIAVIPGDALGLTIAGNIIGLDKTGKTAIGNQMNGITLSGIRGVQVGGDASERNIISANTFNGIEVVNSKSVEIFGNRIGTDIDGTMDRGNKLDGILIDGSSVVSIGDEHAPGNLISGNDGNGIRITGASSSLNQIVANQIGVNAAGDSAIPNTKDGIDIAGAKTTFIGQAAAGTGNLISGNGGNGIHLEGKTSLTQIFGNSIGTSQNRLSAIANGNDGVFVDGASKTFIGSATAAERNVISGNGGDGIEVKGATAANTFIFHNLIGVNGLGTAALGNTFNGVRISSAPKTFVGGGDVPTSNVISGNGFDGVSVSGPESKGTIIAGNFIGTDDGGTAALGNTLDGVHLDGTNGVLVGGLGVGDGNVISGNGNGVVILNDAVDNSVFGNFIGTNATGLAKIANTGSGVMLSDGALSNDIGSDKAGARNIISGNTGNGVLITDGDTSLNQIAGNRIGLNAAGAALPNGVGVLITANAADNIIGSKKAAGANLISGNTNEGVLISAGATDNEVLGNFIGTDPTDAALGNSDGVVLDGAGAGNIIGGSKAGSRNIISANGNNGISIAGGTTGTRVLGNFIGTDLAGVNSNFNGGEGVLIVNSPRNFIGEGKAGSGNLISGNFGDGVRITGAASIGNSVKNNFIGTDLKGQHSTGNGGDGVVIANGAVGNFIDDNLISGNVASGVRITGGATGNKLTANYIGTDAKGQVTLPNTLSGVLVNASPGNSIGVNAAGKGNLISGNGTSGIEIRGGAATANEIFNNFIGTDISGKLRIAGQKTGVFINAAPGNFIGKPGLLGGNLISGNSQDGVLIKGAGADGNRVENNFIGVQVDGKKALGNEFDGVAIDAGQDNIIGGANGAKNTIAFNTFHGVAVINAGAKNRISQNSIFANGGLGIDLGEDGVTPNDPDPADDGDTGPNGLQNFPILTAISDGKGAGVTIFLQSKPSTTYDVELFLNSAADASGNGEGKTYVLTRTVTTDSNGRITDVFKTSLFKLGAILAATATDTTTKDTSEFSAAVTVVNAPPKVVGSTFTLSAGNVSTVVLSFSEALNPAKATNLQNYTLTSAGPDGIFGNGDDFSAGIATAKYDAALETVTLTPKTAIPTGQFVKVFVNGSSDKAVADPSGLKLDGEFMGSLPTGDGTPGGDFTIIQAAAASLSYKDHDGDAVSISLQNGGILQLIRSLDGEGKLLSIIDAIAGMTALNGSVTMSGGGDGTTTLKQIFGLTGVTNNLPSSFVITG